LYDDCNRPNATLSLELIGNRAVFNAGHSLPETEVSVRRRWSVDADHDQHRLRESSTSSSATSPVCHLVKHFVWKLTERNVEILMILDQMKIESLHSDARAVTFVLPVMDSRN
jgi:hypothetical protein